MPVVTVDPDGLWFRSSSTELGAAALLDAVGNEVSEEKFDGLAASIESADKP